MSLFDAVAAGDVARLEALLAGGTDPNPFDAEGRTPLMVAAQQGQEDMVRALLEKGADPTLTDALGEGALTKAAAYGHAHLAELLLPHASEDERDMARALLKVGTDVLATPRAPAPPREDFSHKLASAGAYVSRKLGDMAPTERLERALRAQKNAKKP